MNSKAVSGKIKKISKDPIVSDRQKLLIQILKYLAQDPGTKEPPRWTFGKVSDLVVCRAKVGGLVVEVSREASKDLEQSYDYTIGLSTILSKKEETHWAHRIFAAATRDCSELAAYLETPDEKIPPALKTAELLQVLKDLKPAEVQSICPLPAYSLAYAVKKQLSFLLDLKAMRDYLSSGSCHVRLIIDGYEKQITGKLAEEIFAILDKKFSDSIRQLPSAWEVK